MPDRIKVFLAQTRRPIPPPVPSAQLMRPVVKSMTERWAEFKRQEKKSSQENPGDAPSAS